MFFTLWVGINLPAAGGNITLSADVNIWAVVWEGMPHGAGVSLGVNYIPHVSIKHQMQLLGCFF